jgi:hypothetical protein
MGNAQSKASELPLETNGSRSERNRESPQDPPEVVPECRGSSHLQSPLKADVPTFSGETSIAHTLNQMEDRLEQLGVTYQQCPSAPASQPLTPSPHPALDVREERSKKSYIQQVLLSHNVVIDRGKWGGFLSTFCDEVHVLYPFLHLPIITDIYRQLWDDSFLWSADGHSQREDHRIQIAQVFICLATGRCTGSSRVDTEDGRHSAGWSLYSAAIDIFGDPLDVFREGASPLQVLQTLVLMVRPFSFDSICVVAIHCIYGP